MKQAQTIFNQLYYSLPIRLVVRQIQHHKTLLVFWFMLIGVLSGHVANGFGAAYMFLEPEYLGKEGFWSFFLVGSTLGAFLFAYMVTFYINESYRFPFIIENQRPFFTLTLNNFLVPSLFIGIYFYQFIDYHASINGGMNALVWKRIFALSSGIITLFLIAASYFFTRRGLFSKAGTKLEQELAYRRGDKSRKVILDKAKESFRYAQRADSYLMPFRIVRINHDAYPPFREVVKALNQHHGKLLLLQIFTFTLLAVLGLMEGNRFFQIPAGASLMLMLALGIMIIGAVTFWFRKTGAFTVLAFLCLGGMYNQFDIFHERHQAFGLNYEVAPASYSLDHMASLTADSIYQSDREATLAALEAWKARYQAEHGPYKLPQAMIVTASGGGLRSAFWTFRVMQTIDSLTQGQAMADTRLMTGASGGMFGLTYFRELYWRNQQQQAGLNLQAPAYSHNVSKDLLNRVFFKVFTDIVLPTRGVTVGGNKYDRETGYSFDEQLAVNMPELAGRQLSDYAPSEAAGELPMLVLSPTVINQGRQLYVASSPVSYLARPNRVSDRFLTRSRGVEFRRMFAEQEADSLLMTTALRMNATFPLILPVVSLPSQPAMEVMDAGAIDNYGTQTAVKFLFEFRDWFMENTSGVLLVQIRDNDRTDAIRDPFSTPIGQLLAPLDGGLFSMSQAKDVTNDYLLEFLHEWYDGYTEVVNIEYAIKSSKKPVSLSLHLTQREKQYLEQSLHAPHNELAFNVIREFYNPQMIAQRLR